MSEPAANEEKWSARSAVSTVLALTATAAAVVGWFWATNGISVAHRDNGVLQDLGPTLALVFLAWGLPAGYLWIRGRRRVEDEADRAGRSIKEAQDAYDERPRPFTAAMLRIGPACWLVPTVLPKVLELADQQMWLKAAVAGAILAVAVGLTLWTLLATIRLAAKRWRLAEVS